MENNVPKSCKGKVVRFQRDEKTKQNNKTINK